MTTKIQSSIGSVWRKWDLHIHPPTTKLNDQYILPQGKDIWSEFCQKLEESDISAFGITDYFSADGYFTFIEKFKAKYSDSKKIFFPNVELRTSYVVNSAQEEVNVHIIFNPFVPKYDQFIKKFLQHLNTNKTSTSGTYVKASELSTRTDCEEATTTREFITSAFKETYGDKADLTDYLLVFTAANNDGIRAERGKKRKASITDELDKFSHGFLGNSSNVEYFLKKDRLEGKEEVEAKPVISGCDAHSFTDVDSWLGKLVMNEGDVLKQPTWIKADLTFEGLKYIIYEPKERVFIGDEPDVKIRIRSNQTKYIKSIHIDQIEGYDGKHGAWFKSEKIELNPELVAVIGNKGNGKSAVTDIIGLFGNSHNQKYDGINGKSEELFSFLNKDKFLKGHCASNFSGELHWHAGEPDGKLLNGEVDKSLPEKVEYLPQKYLEKICSNIEDDEFRGKLNEVIFGYVEDKDRYGKITLEELISYLTSQTEEDIKVANDSLHEANKKVVSIEQKLALDYRKSLEEKKRIKEEEVETHNKLKPKEIPKPVKSSAPAIIVVDEITPIETELDKLKISITGIKKEQVNIAKNIEDFGQIKQIIARQVTSLAVLKTKYQEQLEGIGIKIDDIVTISFDSKKIDDFLRINENRLFEIKQLLLSAADIQGLALGDADKKLALEKSLICNQLQLEAKRKEVVDRLDKPNQEHQAYLKESEKWKKQYNLLVGDEVTPVTETLNWLTQELLAITSVYPIELISAKDERKKISKDLFTKKVALSSFYNSVKKSIDGEIKKYSDELGDYNISIEASLRFSKQFFDEFFRFINQSVKGTFHGAEDGKGVLKKMVEEVTDWHDETMVMSFLDSITKSLDIDQRSDLSVGESRERGVFKQMKQSKDPVDLYDYIFSFNYLETKYDLKVDEKDLSELSPGERGGLLLIFYLMLDRRDIPLIIDQPEDNLDNKSVYEILVTFLKKAKKRRQIIMVTHNPNLAVVADAEQIIHVSIDKKNKNDFDFYSGAIENQDINKCVVDILEGTLPAFDNRKLKYRKQEMFQ
jgi:ABC-type lipoprotein export system ATPase subunit